MTDSRLIRRCAVAQLGEALPGMGQLLFDVAILRSLRGHRLVQLDPHLRMAQLGVLVTNPVRQLAPHQRVGELEHLADTFGDPGSGQRG